MKIIPSPPTDNLYKFVAIFGLWLCTVLVVFLGFTNYLVYESAQEARLTGYYVFAEGRINEVSRRIKAIDEGRKLDDLVADIPRMPSLAQEREFLENIRTRFQKNLAERKPVPQWRSQFFEQLDAMGGEYTVAAFSLVAVGCFYFGFRGWYRNVQGPSEQAAHIDLQLKRKELDLKHIELRQKEVELRLKECELRRMERDDTASTPAAAAPATAPAPEPAPEIV